MNKSSLLLRLSAAGSFIVMTAQPVLAIDPPGLPQMPATPNIQQVGPLTEKCKSGDNAACDQLRKLGVETADFAKAQKEKLGSSLDQLCKDGKTQACTAASKLNGKASTAETVAKVETKSEPTPAPKPETKAKPSAKKKAATKAK